MTLRYMCPVLAFGLLALSAARMVRGGELGEPTDVEFKAKVDDTVQRYVQMLPRDFDATRAHDLLIVLHGHGSDRWQYVKQARGECKGARDVAAKRGMIYISPDYRASTSWMGPKAEADVVQIIAMLKAKHKVRRVYLAGASMGGAASLIFATIHPTLVDGVVSENGMANMLEYEGFQQAVIASYGGTKEEVPDEYRRRSPELFPERLTMPLACAVGGLDTAVPPDSVRRLVEKLRKLGKKDLLMLDRPKGGHATNYADTVEALEFVIQTAEAKAAARNPSPERRKKPKEPEKATPPKDEGNAEPAPKASVPSDSKSKED